MYSVSRNLMYMKKVAGSIHIIRSCRFVPEQVLFVKCKTMFVPGQVLLK